MSARSSRRTAVLLLILIVALAIVAAQPIVTAVLLPILTALFVIFLERWMEARKPSSADASKRDLAGRFARLAQLPVRIARDRQGAGLVSPDGRLLRSVALGLFAYGVVMVYSASSRRPGLFVQEGTAVSYSVKFAICGSLGVALMMILAREGLRLAQRFTAALIGLSFVLVLATHIPHLGVDVNGARRWIGNGAFQFEPSELMKLALVLYGAQLIARRPSRVKSLSDLAQPLLYVVGMGCLLVMTQPDVGTAIVIAFAVAALLIGAGLPMGKLAAIVGTLLALLFVYGLLQPYARARLTSFLDPWAHASSSGFQAVQSQIAIGSGGLFGRGLGESIQKAYYLPEANTGFIMAIIGEELGLLGIGVLLFLYGALAYVGLRIAKRARTLYGCLLALGLTGMIVAQAVLNMFSVLGLAPEFGVSLPLISYGSSDMLVTFAAVGLLLNIARENDAREPRFVSVEFVSGAPRRQERLFPLVQQRIGMCFAFFLVLLYLAGMRSIYLGAVRSAALRRDAAYQQVTDEVVPAPRGTITDRFGAELAGSEPAADISADPYLLSEPEVAAGPLAQILGQPTSEVLQKLTEKTGFVYLAHGLSMDHVRAILELRLPGVHATPTTRRTYPRGSLAGQVLGIVGNEDRGMSGLEYGWEKLLHGTEGKRRVITNAVGQPLAVQATKRMVAGAPLQLTLDAYLQSEIEYVLAGISRGCRCRGVAAVVLKPDTGEVLALANWPRVRLGDPTSVGAAEELQADLQNRIISYDFEPGATLDVFSLAGALQESLITPSETFPAPRRVHAGASTVEETTGAGTLLTAGQIATGASRIGTLLVASRLGLSQLGVWLHRFGFGAPSRIALPGESPGHVPSEGEYDRRSLARLPIGQGMSVTPIQLATAYAAIADGGTLRPPHIVARVRSKTAPTLSPSRLLSPTVAKALCQMLAASRGLGVEAPALAANGHGEPGARTGAYVGFAPTDHPEIVTVTLVAEQKDSRNAEALAASAYRQITALVLTYLGTR